MSTTCPLNQNLFQTLSNPKITIPNKISKLNSITKNAENLQKFLQIFPNFWIDVLNFLISFLSEAVNDLDEFEKVAGIAGFVVDKIDLKFFNRIQISSKLFIKFGGFTDTSGTDPENLFKILKIPFIENFYKNKVNPQTQKDFITNILKIYGNILNSDDFENLIKISNKKCFLSDFDDESILCQAAKKVVVNKNLENGTRYLIASLLSVKTKPQSETIREKLVSMFESNQLKTCLCDDVELLEQYFSRATDLSEENFIQSSSSSCFKNYPPEKYHNLWTSQGKPTKSLNFVIENYKNHLHTLNFWEGLSTEIITKELKKENFITLFQAFEKDVKFWPKNLNILSSDQEQSLQVALECWTDNSKLDFLLNGKNGNFEQVRKIFKKCLNLKVISKNSMLREKFNLIFDDADESKKTQTQEDKILINMVKILNSNFEFSTVKATENNNIAPRKRKSTLEMDSKFLKKIRKVKLDAESLGSKTAKLDFENLAKIVEDFDLSESSALSDVDLILREIDVET